MWLLDATMDVHLFALLGELGIRCETASYRGWKALENGALVTVAVGAGFECLLTRDGLFGESAARALKQFPEFAVVVVTLPNSRGFGTRKSSWRNGPARRSHPYPVNSFSGRNAKAASATA